MLKGRFGYDDALDAFGVHGVGGALGALLTGVFAAKAFNPAGADGLLRGGGARHGHADHRRGRGGGVRGGAELRHLVC